MSTWFLTTSSHSSTNSPVELTLKIIHEKLEQDPNLQKRTCLTVEDILELVGVYINYYLLLFKHLPTKKRSSDG